jgi:hypothetical protein
MNIWDIIWFLIDKPANFGADLLFYGWIVITVLLFVDILIPDPLPFIDEFILGALFFAGIALLGIRSIRESIGGISGFFESPLIIGFAVALVVLFIGAQIYDRLPNKGKKRK